MKMSNANVIAFRNVKCIQARAETARASATHFRSEQRIVLPQQVHQICLTSDKETQQNAYIPIEGFNRGRFGTARHTRQNCDGE